MSTNPFDAGVRVNEAGRNWSLFEWGNYYTLNVLGTKSIPHDQFVREFPLASAALAESDRKQRLFQSLLNRPDAAASLFEIVNHLSVGGSVTLEAFPPPQQAAAPAQAAPVAPAQAPGQVAPQAPGAPQGDQHTHQMQADANGNGTTDAVAGHQHQIRGSQILATAGHTHDMAQMNAQAQGQPPAMGAPQGIAQPPPQSQMGG